LADSLTSKQQYDTRLEPASIGGDLAIIAPHPYIRWIQSNPNHDATMRIGREAPKQRCPFFSPAFKPRSISSNTVLKALTLSGLR
jgi:hypothetical protein